MPEELQPLVQQVVLCAGTLADAQELKPRRGLIHSYRQSRSIRSNYLVHVEHFIAEELKHRVETPEEVRRFVASFADTMQRDTALTEAAEQASYDQGLLMLQVLDLYEAEWVHGKSTRPGTLPC